MMRNINISAFWFKYSAVSDEFKHIYAIVQFLSDNKVTVYVNANDVQHKTTFKLVKNKNGYIWQRVKKKSM